MRKKIQLLPRTIAVSSAASNATTAAADTVEEEPEAEDHDARSEGSTATEPQTETGTAGSSMVAAPKRSTASDMTDAQAKTKVTEDVKEIFAVRSVSEAEQCFEMLPDEHQSKLIDAIVTRALDAKEDDVRLATDVFAKASKVTAQEAFEDGFASTVEFLEDIAIDVPQVYPRLAKMMKGAGLGRAAVERLAQKIAVDGDPVKHPRDKLLGAFDALA